MLRSAIRFTAFERVSGCLQEGEGKVHVLNALAAGTVAGAAESATCLTPLQNMQIKMTEDANSLRHTRIFRYNNITSYCCITDGKEARWGVRSHVAGSCGSAL